MEITPIKGTVTYTLDELDRVYLRNVYKDDTVQRARNPGIGNTGGLVLSPQKPKELIYQDVHYYNTNVGGLAKIKRLYKPQISTPIDAGGTITATVSSESHIIAAGFHYSANEDSFLFKVIQPRLLNQISSYWHHTFTVPIGTAVTLTKASAGGGYYKAFAIIETGTLFSRTLAI